MSDHEPPAPSDATVTNLDTAQRLAAGQTVAGRYRVTRLLGLGAMGLVYEAHDDDLDLDVALKVLRPEYSNDAALIERFRRELVLARQVSHENVVRIHDLGKDGELLFLTMDLVVGRSLREVLEGDEPMDAATAVSICRQLARGLAAAHDQGIVHRDLKPSNVMIDGSGRALITDFGVARSMTAAGLTGTGIVVGTPDYLAPEQYRGEELDGRCDIYALGVVLFEMLAGRRPFSDGTAAESMAQRMSGLPPKLPELGQTPSNLRHIIRRCLEPDRNRRYATGLELDADLENLTRPKRQPPRLRTVLGTLAALALVALLGIAGWRLLSPASPAGDALTQASVELQTLAVLPFVDETGQAEFAWLARGVPELLFESMVTSGSIQAVDPQRVFSALADLKLEPATLSASGLSQAAELFDADRLLVGSVRSDGSALRIDARLVAGTAGVGAIPLNVGATQGPGAASRLVVALEAALLDALAIQPVAEPETMDLDTPALPAYAEATRLLRQGDSLGARELLEEAVALDPEFGPAFLRLSQAYEGLGLDAEALAAADRAIAALGDDLGRVALAAQAQQARLAGDGERSQQLLKELVARYPTDLETSVQLADAFGAAGRIDEALAGLEHVVEQAPNHPQAWYLRAKYSILSGSSRLAVDDYLVRAMVIQNKLRNRQGQADVLNAFGVAYRQLGELEQAEQSYQRAAELRREIGDERGYATTLRNLAQIAIARGRFEDAEANLLAARAKLEELGDEGGISDLYNELGMMEEARGRHDESLERFRQALQIRRRLGDQRAIAESLNNIGFASHELGRVDDAGVYWNQALELFNETGNRQGQVSVRQSLGQLQTTQGQWTSANASYLEALELSRQLEWTPAVAASLGFLGRVAHYQGRFQASLDYYDEALGVFAAIEDAQGLVEFGLARVALLLDLGELDLAAENAAGLEAHLDSVGSSDQQAEALRLAARSAAARGDVATARKRLDAASAMLDGGGSRGVQLRVALAQARVDGATDPLRQVFDEATGTGDIRLSLEAGTALFAAHLKSGDFDTAGSLFSRVERLLRPVGDYAGSYSLWRARAQLAAAQGATTEIWDRRATEELARISQGLTPARAEHLAEARLDL